MQVTPVTSGISDTTDVAAGGSGGGGAEMYIYTWIVDASPVAGQLCAAPKPP